jgi:hypothetical protein
VQRCHAAGLQENGRPILPLSLKDWDRMVVKARFSSGFIIAGMMP